MESKNKKKMKLKAKAVATPKAKAKVVNNIYITKGQRSSGARLTAPSTMARGQFQYPFPMPQAIITPQGGVIQPTQIQALEQSINNLTTSIGLTQQNLFNPPQQNFNPVNARPEAQQINLVPAGMAQMEAQPMVSETMNMAGGSSSLMGLQAPVGQLRSQATMTNTPRLQTQSLPVIGNMTIKTQTIQPLPSITKAGAQLSATPASLVEISTADNPEFNNRGGRVMVNEGVQATPEKKKGRGEEVSTQEGNAYLTYVKKNPKEEGESQTAYDKRLSIETGIPLGRIRGVREGTQRRMGQMATELPQVNL
jgi:hypothetical protein